jgi:hypothetical protein
MDASHEAWRDDPPLEPDSPQPDEIPLEEGQDLESTSEDDFYVLLDLDEADAVAAEGEPATGGEEAPVESPLAVPAGVGASASGAQGAPSEAGEEGEEWLLRGPEEVTAANAEEFIADPDIPPEILAAGTPRAAAYEGRGERRLRRLLALGSVGAGALLILFAGLVYMKRVASSARPRRPATQGEAPLVARGPEAKPPAPGTSGPGVTGSTTPLPAVPTNESAAPSAPSGAEPGKEGAAPGPISPAPEVSEPVEPELHPLGPGFRYEDPDRPRITLPTTLTDSEPAPTVPETAGPVSVRTPEGGFVLLKAGQVLVGLRNGNHFVGRIYRISTEEIVLRVPSGEIVLGTRTLSRIVPLVGAKEPGIDSLPDGYVELHNGNRIWGKILEESDKVVAIGFASAKITIPRSAVNAVGRGLGTSIEFVGN